MKFAGYSRNEIDEMDDLSIFRRFFVVSNILRELISSMNPTMGDAERVPSSNMAPQPSSAVETPVDMSQTMGGGFPAIKGGRPARSSRPRRRRTVPQIPNTASYGFPNPVD